MGCEEDGLVQKGTAARFKRLKMLELKQFAAQGSNLAGRQGFFWRISRDPNKDGRFSRKPRRASNFAFSDFFVGFRPVSSFFGFSRIIHGDDYQLIANKISRLAEKTF